MIRTALYIIALICFLLDMAPVQSRINLQSLGLALLTLTLVIPAG